MWLFWTALGSGGVALWRAIDGDMMGGLAWSGACATALLVLLWNVRDSAR